MVKRLWKFSLLSLIVLIIMLVVTYILYNNVVFSLNGEEVVEYKIKEI